MAKLRLFYKEFILIIIFILLIILEFYLINIDELYIALIAGIFAFIFGILLLRFLTKKLKNFLIK